MALSEVKIVAGINKQVTPTGAEGRWIDCDNVRFRYGYPEKIGGWEQTTVNTLVGVGRDTHIWADLEGKRYIVIGTHKGLFLYYAGAFYDMEPTYLKIAHYKGGYRNTNLITVIVFGR